MKEGDSASMGNIIDDNLCGNGLSEKGYEAGNLITFFNPREG